MLSHAITNLSASELEDYYGNRIRYRMREMFNLLHLTVVQRIRGNDGKKL